MRCIVTAGPTYEPLDKVRRLTNFSTGKLGIELGNHLVHCGHDVTLLRAEQSTWHGSSSTASTISFGTTDHLASLLQGLQGYSVDAVFHVAAVSDFRFGKIYRRDSATGVMQEVREAKISTRNGVLMAELFPTQKIIASLRAWFPKAVLVGWKYEVDGDRASAQSAARLQIYECQTHACVLNGPAAGSGFHFICAVGQPKHCETASDLFCALEAFITGRGLPAPG